MWSHVSDTLFGLSDLITLENILHL